jgi:tetratricopeptide (TPR) repeat protein
VLAAVAVVVIVRQSRSMPTPDDQSPVVARIADRPIPRDTFERQLDQRLAMAGPHAVSQRATLAPALLEEFIVHEVWLRQARARGLDASAEEVLALQDERVDQLIAAQFPDREELMRKLREGGRTFGELREKVRTEDERVPSTEVLRQSIIVGKLQEALLSAVAVGEREVRRLFGTVTLERMRIEAAPSPEEGVRLPDDPEVRAAVARAAEEALTHVRAGCSFTEAAERLPKELVRAWVDPPQEMPLSSLPEEVAHASAWLEIGQLSEPVPVGDDFHVIVVRGRSERLPPNYDEVKEQCRQELLAAKREEVWRALQEEALERGWQETELYDEELKAYRKMDLGVEEEEIDAALRRAAAVDPENATVVYLQGRRLLARAKAGGVIGRKEKWERALALLEKAHEMAPECPAVLTDLASVCRSLGRGAEALDYIEEASSKATTWDKASLFVHLRARSMFTTAKADEQAQREQEWITRWSQRLAEARRGNAAATPGAEGS